MLAESALEGKHTHNDRLCVFGHCIFLCKLEGDYRILWPHVVQKVFAGRQATPPKSLPPPECIRTCITKTLLYPGSWTATLTAQLTANGSTQIGPLAVRHSGAVG